MFNLSKRLEDICIIIGGLIALWLFGLAFNLSTSEFNQKAIFPIVILSISSFILGFLSPSRWLRSGLFLAMPNALWSLWMFFGVLTQLRKLEWFHLISLSIVLACSMIGTFTGATVRKFIKAE